MSEYVLMSGNEATAEGGIAGGCRYFFCYPITPQNKIPEYMSRNLPEVGGNLASNVTVVRPGPSLGRRMGISHAHPLNEEPSTTRHIATACPLVAAV